jgi:hypothetical protein
VSETDSFLEEVAEEVRRDKLYAYARKYGWIAVLTIILLVGGAAYFEWSKARTQAAAQARGDAVIAALNIDAASERAAALAEVAADAGPAGVVIELRRAAVLTEAGDTEAALAVLDQIASSPETAELYRELAKLKAVILRGPDMDQGQRMAALDALANPGAPFRPVALEQRAVALLDAGDTAAALEQLQDLLQEPGVSSAMRNRTQQLIMALGGEVPEASQLLSTQ